MTADLTRQQMRHPHFITVPAVTLPNGTVVPSFQVSQYMCSRDVVGTPWVNISYYDARKACEQVGAKLITELQALAIAHDIANQDINWSGGKVGEGHIYQGLHRGSVDVEQARVYESEDPDERRWHQLSNGERIYDFSGNAYTPEFTGARLWASACNVVLGLRSEGERDAGRRI